MTCRELLRCTGALGFSFFESSLDVVARNRPPSPVRIAHLTTAAGKVQGTQIVVARQFLPNEIHRVRVLREDHHQRVTV